MTLEEIQKAFPVSSAVRYRGSGEIGAVTGHRVYNYPADPRSGQSYVNYKVHPFGDNSAWPEDLILIKALSPLELDIKAYIDEEMRQLSC